MKECEKRIISLRLWLVLAVFCMGLAGCAPGKVQSTLATIPMDMEMEIEIPAPTAQPTGTPDTDPNEQTPPDGTMSKISCDQVGRLSGLYVEDGSDRSVENVAAILATNRTGEFLELASMQFEIDGEPATFVVTGLPPGESAWVMEASAMSVGEDAKFVYKSCGTAFRDNVFATADEVAIIADDGMLTAVNRTDRTLKDVFIYYKVLHDDGNFYGGITYMVAFGTLEPGQSVEKVGGHYGAESARIVRIGWQEVESEA